MPDARDPRDSDTMGRRDYDGNSVTVSVARWPQYVQLAITVGTIIYGAAAFAQSSHEQQAALATLSRQVESMTSILYQTRSDVDVLRCRDGITCVGKP